MAIRYSGDVEIRMRREDGRIYGVVRDPRVLWRGVVRASFYRSVISDYDHAARELAERAAAFATRRGYHLAAERRNGRIVVSRIFQAPCPCDVAEKESWRTRRKRGRG